MRSFRLAGKAIAAIAIVWAAPALAQPRPADPALSALRQRVQVVAEEADGRVTFVTGKDNAAIPLTVTGRAGVQPADFLAEYGALFGVSDPGRELVQSRVVLDDLGGVHTTFEQVHEGVPVFAGMLKVHSRADGLIYAANGAFHPISEKLMLAPLLGTADAVRLATADLDAASTQVDRAELVIVDPGWYGDPPRGARLAYYLIVSDLTVPLREAMFIDARTGDVLDQWSLILGARDRRVYNGNGGASLPGTLVRSEGAGPVASPADVNRAYDYAGDIYDYYFRAFGRDSIDGAGMPLILTVNSTAPDCPNAFWNSAQMVFCSGTVTDDITAHEMTHGVTEHTANLIYQNQSGQLNESYSDVFGELIDLYNGNASIAGTPSGSWPSHATGPGQDTPNNLRSACSLPSGYANGVRWLMGEDASAFGGAIRDMWNPTCMGDPDRGYSSLQTCNALDSGGVHSGSGIPNHAFAMVTDGKTFNGQTVTGIGPIKAGAVWYRALVAYLTPASDFRDASFALSQAALDLVGTTPNDPVTGAASSSVFTASDAEQVAKAMIATEMDQDGACGATVDVLNPLPPPLCSPRTALYADHFEGGANGWTASLTGSPDTPYTWVQRAGLPFNRPGTAWYCEDLNDGCPSGGEESAVHVLTSPAIALPAQASGVQIQFTHYLATEASYDGGNVKLSVNGGAFALVPASAFTFNDYNSALTSSSNTNPLAGQPAWTGAGGQWGTSVIDLTGIADGGDTIQVRFEFGKDYCNGVDGWYVDDFEVFVCSCADDADCDDGLFCNGTETCIDNVCSAGADPCPGGYCNDTVNACADAVFVETFDNGNIQGWSLRGAGSTATTGDWLFGNPNGTSSGGAQAQPEDPYAGSGCAFTAQNSSLGTDDVDGGVIYLVSPAINLAGESIAQLNYVRWYYNRDTGTDNGDFFIAQVSADNGANWATLENLNYLINANEWTLRSFDLQNYIALTAQVRVRFGVSDGAASGGLLEGAIDSLSITTVAGCSSPAECDDGNPCNGAEDCFAGQCVPGVPLNCDDGVACTVDSCDPQTGCASTPNDQLCASDGVFCNGAEYCDSGSGCQSAGDPCTGGTWCDEGTAACQAYGNGDLDSDGDMDLRDFALFQACYGAPAGPACWPANLTGDALIDAADLAAFVGGLSGGGPN